MNRKAFTLFEVAVVICVITLAAVAIFAAQTFYSRSGIRGLAAQIKKYDQSIEAFRTKYQGLPGDVRNTINQGLSSENTDGDANGIITSRTMELAQANGEISNFWLHLSKSKFLDETYDGGENELVKFGKTFPISKLGDSAGIVVFGVDGKNYYQVGFKFANIDRLYTGNRSVAAEDAFLFDKKIDDGDPLRGQVVAVGSDVLNFPASDVCVKNGKYNADVKSPFCQLRITLGQ